MKQIAIFVLAAGLNITPVIAQDQPAPDEGAGLMREGARLLLRGLLNEVEPAIDDISEMLAEMGPAFSQFALTVGPAFADLLDQVDDFSNYEVPEFLPNGDIIIRRRPDAPDWHPVPETDNGEVEL